MISRLISYTAERGLFLWYVVRMHYSEKSSHWMPCSLVQLICLAVVCLEWASLGGYLTDIQFVSIHSKLPRALQPLLHLYSLLKAPVRISSTCFCWQHCGDNSLSDPQFTSTQEWQCT